MQPNSLSSAALVHTSRLESLEVISQAPRCYWSHRPTESAPRCLPADRKRFVLSRCLWTLIYRRPPHRQVQLRGACLWNTA